MKTILIAAGLMALSTGAKCDGDFYNPQKIKDVVYCQQESTRIEFLANLKMYGRSVDESVIAAAEQFRIKKGSEDYNFLKTEAKLAHSMADYATPAQIGLKYTATCLMGKGYKLSDVYIFLGR